MKKSIGMHSVHHLEIFFWRGQNTEPSSTIESPLVWSKITQGATSDSALRYVRYILSFYEFYHHTIN